MGLKQDILDRLNTARYELRESDPEAAWTYVGEAARLTENLPDDAVVPPPPPPPPVATMDSFGGTYDASHGMAFDLYPNGEDGPHPGFAFFCPAECIVERYAFQIGVAGKLEVHHHTGSYAGKAINRNGELDELLRYYSDPMNLLAAGPMIISVATPNVPVTINGYRAVRFWYGHVQDGFGLGRRLNGDMLFRCGTSGLESLPGEPGHVHCCASATGQLTPNGDLPGIIAAKWVGRNPRVTWVPGPQQYMTGRYYRGKAR